MATAENSNNAKLSARQKCYDVLRRMLICGQILPGSRLPEVEWSERLEVHRGGLREALVLLEHDGLLTQGEKGGFFAPILGDFEFEEIMQARCVLETGAIKLIAARQLPQSAFQPLLDLCETMQRLHEAAIELGFCEADFMFHQTLVSLSGNSRLIQMYSHSAQLIFNLSPVDTVEVARSKRAQTMNEHREICRLVMAGKTDQAIQLLERHMSQPSVSD
ncbi:GntR family transcriptional regulator [Blastopirellula sp. JC732]|uniref:GntR family transcriptional regulator n=1 Tax=Blastopirellula sediminis TaxID=2894196 RepID=A0A9X1SLX5_9BACT|nr:GntR family transcriptional regulator [Blastopirellula sediminis]MCC9605546.1 GntR family transcriptional regulator [Blastopirellula sediminis]MCC9631154.1 GntR family transcriptional regulator [Blastopirellula sediminis]